MKDMDVAIVGMACRFPGARNYDEFWRNVAAGRNSVREVPPERWDWRAAAAAGGLSGDSAGWGGFIEDVDKFDPLFFGISPTEAAFMDPQHRLFLETAWHAVEDAGYGVSSLGGRAIGVYAGVSKNDYAELMRERGHPIVPYVSTGTVHSILVNRVSFLFNLVGRSEAVDTACSSSLVALHNAMRDLAAGECEAALVGGVNALISPTMFVSHSKSGMLSADGQCKTFSAGANGYVRAEGVGVLFVKPLARALEDRDHVHAVIKGSAINHGGRANFLTSPTTEAQAAVVAKALRAAGVEPHTIGYIEAHGTGTPLGDPIEINGLKRAFAQVAREQPASGGGREQRCALGSVKTNVGHLESASGMAGLIKAVMAMQKRQIPALANFTQLNPYIELDGSPFYIPQERQPWIAEHGPRRAGVSSFGMGGVNAHVVLEEAPPRARRAAAGRRTHAAPLSARKGRLRESAAALSSHLKRLRAEDAAPEWRDVAFTLQSGRDAFEERLAVVASSLDELIEGLDAHVNGAAGVFVAEGAAEAEEPERLARRWVQGEKVAWGSAAGDDGARRVPLPPYPFARKRCWFSDSVDKSAGAAGAKSAGTAPSPTAPRRAAGGSTTKTVRPTDFFVRDHVVQGRRTVPGVMHLELARAAAEARGDVGIVTAASDVYWMTPIVVEEEVPLDVTLTGEGAERSFEIRHGERVFSKGKLTCGSHASRTERSVDLAEIEARCGRRRGHEEIYALLRRSGLDYGPTFRALTRCAHSDHEIVAELSLPRECDERADTHAWHPSLLDGVFQTVTLLSVLGLERTDRQYVPFFLEAVKVLAPIPERAFVHATVAREVAAERSSMAFNAVLLDAAGHAVAIFTGLQKRPLADAKADPQAASDYDVVYRPVWRRRQPEARAAGAAGGLVIFGDGTDATERVRQAWGADRTLAEVRPGDAYRRLGAGLFEIAPAAFEHYERLFAELRAGGTWPTDVAYLWGLMDPADDHGSSSLERSLDALLGLTQAAFKARLPDGLHLAYVYRAEQAERLPIHALVSGFARTLKYENPGFSYVTLGLDDAALGELASVVRAELHTASLVAPLRDVLYQGGSRHERVMLAEPLPAWSDGDAAPAVKPGGVYVISGGAGGLGLVFSRHLARTRGATVVWLGRSPSTPSIAAKADEIARAGGRCDYHGVDVRDASALERVLAEVRRVHGRIDGVLHAAAVVEDAFILRKERAALARVVAPKVDGVVNLDHATRHDELDFFVAFSSIAALMPNQGQCAYAAANSFLDSFLEARNARVARRERSGVSLSLNWPLWAEGGIRVSADEERHLLKAFGMRPMPAREGLEVFERALALARRRFPELHQLAVVSGDAETIERCLGVSARGDGAEPVAGLDAAGLVRELQTLFAEHLGMAAESIEAGRPIGEFGITSSAIVEVIARVNECFGAELKPTVLFDVNTLEQLAEHLTALGKTTVVARPRRFVQRWNRSLIDLEHSDAAAGSFSRTFKTSEFYLRDHVVEGQYNMPGACYVEMARQAAAVMLGERVASRLLNNYWASPLSSPGEDFKAHVQISKKHGGWSYEIASHTPSGERRLHATGEFVETDAPRDAGPAIDLVAVMARCAELRHPARVYEQILAEGLVVAATFRPMQRIHLGAGEALAELELTDEARPTGGDFVLHPALLTGAFQAALVSNKQHGDNGRRYIPIGIDLLEVSAPLPAECWVRSRTREANAKSEELRKFDLEICARDGVVVARLEGFAIRALKESRATAEPGGSVGARRPEVAAGELHAPASAVSPAPRDQPRADGSSAEGATHSEDRAREAMHAYLRALMAKPIGLQAEEIDARTGFDEYGVNSVMVVELNEALERRFGSLSKTLFFEYRNVDELAQYFLSHHSEASLRVLREAGALTPAAPTDAGHVPQVAVLERTSGASEHGAADDVAIVSAAGRFPGARDLEEFWDVLRTGRDCITEIPEDGHFDYRKYFDADPDSGRIYSRWGGFIDDVDCFDPAFFGISPREAELIDPQERLLLEVVWETFERAGYTRERLARQEGKRVGVFVGALWQPYESVGIEATLAGNVVGPSSLLYSIANRVSFFFDFCGPSLALDTACSSSLTALHLACQSIRSGECRSAIVGGVNLSRSASKYLFLARNRFLSTDGRCRSYGAGGDGYVPGEGVCALFLKPLTQAVADGDVIRAVIKGTAVNHGGRTNGYTVPSPRAQGNVIAAALEASRIDPRAITYLEGHGTGTALGDPIEIDGLKKALSVGSGRPSCAIGSVKSNIGHLEAAAGVASVIKVLLQMDHGQLVPSLHADRLNPNIDFGDGLFVVQRTLEPWPQAVVVRDGREATLTRCAGVSSFGAGGSNAHAILQQYDGAPPELASATRRGTPALCVFSARSDERLKALLTRFGAFLAQAPGLELHDVAYTLQLGREALRERLAIVAGSLDELRRSIDGFLAGQGEGRAWSRGRAGASPARPTAAGEPRRGATRDQLLRLADEWLAGGDVDWSAPYGGRSHRFLTLPTYPFARERYWIEGAAPATHGAPPAARAVVAAQHGHPLAQRNTSDLDEQRYSSTFSGAEFFLADHRVRTDGAQVQAVLPGVAYLEMARAAVVQASPRRPEGVALELRAVVWAQPLVVAAPTEVHVALSTDDSGEVTYEVYSEAAGDEVLHCQGRVAWPAEATRPRLDLRALRRRMDQGELPASDVYSAFARRGLHLGPSFQAIERILLGRDELLSELRLPPPVEAVAQAYGLHPSLMDGALQGSLGLLDGWYGSGVPLRVPFALESLTLLAPFSARMLAWVRRAPEGGAGSQALKVDVDLCDEDGLLCARVRGFATCTLEAGLGTGRRRRADEAPPVEAPSVAAPRGETVTLTAVWDAVEPDLGESTPRPGERVLVFGGDGRRRDELKHAWGLAALEILDDIATIDELRQALRAAAGRVDHVVWLLAEPVARTAADESLIADQERGVVAGFRLVQALLREGYGARDLAWTVITSGTQSAGGRSDARVDATHASVHGLIGSMAKEYAHWRTRLVDFAADTAWPWAELRRLRPDERGDGWSQRRGQWYRRRLMRCSAETGAVAPGACGFRRGGTYVLIGGAGGVGQAVSAHLLEVYDARVAWIGRRAEDAAIASRRARAAAKGGEPPLYVAADARRRDALEAALQEIKTRWGRIDGVIHSAIVLSDKSLAQMDEEQFRASLSAKVDTAVRVEQVFGSEPLDFILYLSSLQTFLKAAGQSNYSAGCTFVDAFADWQASRAAYPVKVMSWGYWGSVGVVAGPEYGARLARLGWGSIEPEEGVAAVERLLTGPLRQAGFLRATHAGALDVLGVVAGERLERAGSEAPAVCARLAAEGSTADDPRPDELLAWREQLVETDRALLTMLRRQLEALGGPGAIERWGVEEWIACAGVAREHERWLRESQRLLTAPLALEAPPLPHPGEPGADAAWWREWERAKAGWERRSPGCSAQLKLVEAALHGLGDVLRGRKRPTDVLFPDSSLTLVGAVYKNNAVADHFNAVMADVLLRHVAATTAGKEGRPAGLRVLELGAGTGGSTAALLPVLDTCGVEVSEYRYTDVSRLFLVHGEQAYGGARRYLKFALANVEHDLEEQGIAPGTYDVVVAANVLHATRRLRQTLRHAKAALKTNGLLLLDEISSDSVFRHLTFGLLAGWWAYEDDALRMEGNPGLTPEAWQRVLEDEGFGSVWFPAERAHVLGQQVVVAESDGWTRRRARIPPAARVETAATAAPDAPPRARALAAARQTEPAASAPGGAHSGWREKLEASLVDAVVRLLKAKREQVDLDVELGEFGFDSISLTGLANHLNRAFGLELMPTLFFEHPTLRRVGEHLLTRHAAELSQVFGADAPTSSPRARPAAIAVAARPVSAPRLLPRVEQWLIEAVGVLLKVKRADVDLDVEFGEFGFDSISFTGFANHINRAYGLELMPTLFFEQPTVRALARHLVEKHAAALAARLGSAVDEGDLVERISRPAQVPAPERSRRRGRLRVTEAPEPRGSSLAPQADAIAIIGVSARFPGARDLAEFWANLEAGRESICEVPPERWDWRELADGDAASGMKWGAFIDDVDRFDPLFFGISPREAELIDPQHRLTMMYGWKALEDAGYGPKRLWGSRTGIFVGTTSTGYGEQLLTRAGAGIEGYSATGLVPSVGPNRLSYMLNLHGPSEPIETACSSSLVAVHRAVGSLTTGECDLALVGGVNTLFPTLHVSFGKAGMLSPEGKCKTFSSRADGYVRGEGVGMLVLKRLRDAERDGDHVYALVRGSAENHGGRGQSLTAPNPQAQSELIQDALRRAGVNPRSVSYVEAHGTGTPLGDPVEIAGLKSAFETLGAEFGEPPEAGYCGLGSVKTNIGHLELAAGIAGVLKVVLQMQHRRLVRSLHCDEVNPYIQLEGSPFYVVRENRAWVARQDAQGRPLPLRAGVSSFGFGGVNAHVVLEEYVGGREQPLEAVGQRGATAIVVLSAKDNERLRERASQLRTAIERGELDDERLTSAAYTLQVGREAMDHRLAATVATVADLDARLRDFLEGRSEAPDLYVGEVKRGSETLLLFRDDDDLREAVGKWMQRGKWAKLLDLWVKGLDVDWEQLYGESRPRKISLPSYPFAREICWFDMARRAPERDVKGAPAVLHPLLHVNTSVLGEQRYSTSLKGDEFFLRDHRLRLQGGPARGVLPGVAYLEMARAALEQASAAARRTDVLELRNHVWLKPVLAGEHGQLSVALFETEGDEIEYEITSRHDDAPLTHCQGEALWLRRAAPARVDVAALEAKLARERADAARVYAMFTELGFEYGPTHRAIVRLAQGDGQLLAHLRLPADVEASEADYWLHPSLMDGALQAAACLGVDLERELAAPQVPFALESLRVVARCAREMLAWVRPAEAGGRGMKLDVDLLDGRGQVCVQLRGYTARALSGSQDGRALRRTAVAPQDEFDGDFYRNLLAGIASRDVSVDEAVEIG